MLGFHQLTPWLAAVLCGVASASTLTPPVLPLIVRNPYLNTHLGNAREAPWSKWPIFWTGQEMGMSMMAHVPDSGLTFPLLGRPQDSLGESSHYNVSFPKYLGASFDASTTNLTYEIPPPSDNIQPLKLTISFLSPITPKSSLRQSIPASYISVIAEGTFDIDFYMDLNGQWISGNRDRFVQWHMSEIDHEDKTSLRSWQFRRPIEEHFTEFADRAEWGTLHLTTAAAAGFEAGTSQEVRQKFARHGQLSNTVDDRFRRIMDDEPIFAFHEKLYVGAGRNATKDRALFTITHVQHEVVQFASERGLTFMRPLWASFFFTTDALLTFHYNDYEQAAMQAHEYSAQLAKDAVKAGGRDYVDIVALSARQVLGATSFSGTPENPLIFLKEISSNGNTQTVDVIFPAFPFFMYTNPRWLAYLLEPLLEHQMSGQYPNKYSMHDLGAHFPNLTGHADGNDEYMPVEECGDMLIMGLALVNSLKHSVSRKAQSLWSNFGSNDAHDFSTNEHPFRLRVEDSPTTRFLDDSWGGNAKGDKQAEVWTERTYRIWKQWTEYLIESSLEPANQLCTDDFAGWLPLQTNLALKGIVGIKAMSELSALLGKDKDVKYYQNISDTYIEKWQDFGMARDGTRAKLAYDWYGSWTTLYSLFPDTLLCFHTGSSGSSSGLPYPHHIGPSGQKPLSLTDSKSNKTHRTANFIPSELYANQSRWYQTSMQKYGLPLDSRHLYSKSDWQLEAAAVASPRVKRDIVSRLANWLNETDTDLPFTDLYFTEGTGGFGAGNRFAARPVVGAHFSLLAVERACGGHALEDLSAVWTEEEL